LNEKNKFNVEQKKPENLKNNIEKFFLFFKTDDSKMLGTLKSDFNVDEGRLFLSKLKFEINF